MLPPLFNPLDTRNLGKSVVDALTSTAEVALEGLSVFKGAGVYALYYSGDFKPYQRLAVLNRTQAAHPIYVGKAVPSGGRKGLKTDASIESQALFKRLSEHRESVEMASNLRPGDFRCRYLIVEAIWIGLGETLLIQRFNPLWNQVVEGFGNHPPGKGRHKGMRPLWDELHPGRAWARKCKAAKHSRDDIIAAVEAHLAALPAP